MGTNLNVGILRPVRVSVVDLANGVLEDPLNELEIATPGTKDFIELNINAHERVIESGSPGHTVNAVNCITTAPEQPLRASSQDTRSPRHMGIVLVGRVVPVAYYALPTRTYLIYSRRLHG